MKLIVSSSLCYYLIQYLRCMAKVSTSLVGTANRVYFRRGVVLETDSYLNCRITEKEIETWAYGRYPMPRTMTQINSTLPVLLRLFGLEPGGIVTFAFPRVISAAHYYLIYADGTVEDLGGSGFLLRTKIKS